uniref:Immunoglobulin V-set domain-containing protein n=1 Tax=Cyprinus carpio carpio TaxID=630221 RepID=A0A9J8AFN9_CYPCA
MQPSSVSPADGGGFTSCQHLLTTDLRYRNVYWYMLGFKLMGYLNYDNENKELEFEKKIKLDGDGQKNGTLIISNLMQNDSAVYFCAAYYTVLRILSV